MPMPAGNKRRFPTGLLCCYDNFGLNILIQCDVRSGVYDLSGRLVSTVSESSLLAGSHAFAWDASVSAGVYAVRLDAGSKTVTRLMTVCFCCREY